MNRKLLYINQGRGGTVIYRDAVSEIKFDFEFGGGNCIAIIFIPSPDNWVNATNRKAEERNDIIQFVAEQATRDQVSNGHFSISDQFIEIFK